MVSMNLGHFDWILNLLVEAVTNRPNQFWEIGDMRGQFNIGKKSLPLLKCTQYLGIMMILEILSEVKKHRLIAEY